MVTVVGSVGFKDFVSRFDQLTLPSAGKSKEISRRLMSVATQLGLAELLDQSIGQIYSTTNLESQILNLLKMKLAQDAAIRRKSGSRELVQELANIVSDIRLLSVECEANERQFFDAFGEKVKSHNLLEQFAHWIHYPNCSLGGTVLLAADKLLKASTSAIPFKHFSELVLSWHYALARRIAFKPDIRGRA